MTRSGPIASQPTTKNAAFEMVTSFRKGELAREIALRGMTQKEFAALAGLAENTITKANQGKVLRADIWGTILVTLGANPQPEIPAGLVEAV